MHASSKESVSTDGKEKEKSAAEEENATSKSPPTISKSNVSNGEEYLDFVITLEKQTFKTKEAYKEADEGQYQKVYEDNLVNKKDEATSRDLVLLQSIERTDRQTNDPGYVDFLMEQEQKLNKRKEQEFRAYYIVKKGDTLYRIAKNNQTSVEKIKELNNLTSNVIRRGMTLIIQ